MCRVQPTQRFFLGQGEFKQKPVPQERGKERQGEGEAAPCSVTLNKMDLSLSKHKSVQSCRFLYIHTRIQMHYNYAVAHNPVLSDISGRQFELQSEVKLLRTLTVN